MNKGMVLLIGLLFIFSLVGLAIAEDNIKNVSLEQNKSISSKNWSELCSKINELVAKKISDFDNGKVRRENSYSNMEDRIGKVIARANSTDLNATHLEADFSVLQQRIDQFNQDYSNFITQLKSLQNYTCGSSEGQFKSALSQAKLMLPILRNDSAQIRLQSSKVKNDLKILKLNRERGKLENKVNKIEKIENTTEKRLNITNQKINASEMRINDTEREKIRLAALERLRNRTKTGINASQNGSINKTGGE